MGWLELSVSVDPEAAEAVSEVLARHGYQGGVVLEPAFIPGRDGPEFTIDSSRPVVLRTYLRDDEHADALRRQIAEALWHLGRIRPIGELQVRRVAEEDWANAWKQYYDVQRIGARTVIVPSWLEYAPAPGEVVLLLDPGMAFGTGLHPTTRLCLRLLEQLVQPGQDALDLGCGSGILALAIAQLGAGHVLAVDNDPIAVAATRDNVVRNGRTETISAAEGSLGAGAEMGHWLSGNFGEGHADPQAPGMLVCKQPDGTVVMLPAQFDLIAANLIARVLITLAPDLAAALRPGGALVTSGIIIEREDEVALAFAAAGLSLRERHQEGEWVAFVHTRASDEHTD